MVREQTAGNRRDRGGEAECTNLDCRGVEADEPRGGFVVTDRAHFEPDLRALQGHDEYQDGGRPRPDIIVRDVVHTVKAAGAAHHVEIEEETADHLAKPKRR